MDSETYADLAVVVGSITSIIIINSQRENKHKTESWQNKKTMNLDHSYASLPYFFPSPFLTCCAILPTSFG